MKPRIRLADWLAAFERLKDLPKGTRLYAGTRKFRLVHVYGASDDHRKRLELAELHGNKASECQVRPGDPLIFDLTTTKP